MDDTYNNDSITSPKLELVTNKDELPAKRKKGKPPVERWRKDKWIANLLLELNCPPTFIKIMLVRMAILKDTAERYSLIDTEGMSISMDTEEESLRFNNLLSIWQKQRRIIARMAEAGSADTRAATEIEYLLNGIEGNGYIDRLMCKYDLV